jgi:hypothetical protein
MEAWHIADDYLRRNSWSMSPTTKSSGKATDSHDVMERQEELSTTSSLQVEEEDQPLLTLRHSHNPRSSPLRVLFGTLLLSLMILLVVKMLQIRFHTYRPDEE